jgi:hypothetical protein
MTIKDYRFTAIHGGIERSMPNSSPNCLTQRETPPVMQGALFRSWKAARHARRKLAQF